MRVLIYIEPLLERERPFWKRGWVDAFGPIFYDALHEGGVDSGDIAFIVPEPFLNTARDRFPGARVATIPHAVFVPGMADDSLSLARAWYEDGIAHDRDAVLVEQLLSALDGFTPDVAISYTPAPFLKQAWPGLSVLHFEVGMFSRAPYPMTVYLDPFGMFHRGAPARFGKSLSAREPAQEDVALVEAVRVAFGYAMFGAANPFHELLPPRLDEYSRATLLVLQFSDFYAYDAHARYRAQYDWLIATLENTPRDVALIVTEHPDHPLFDDDTYRFLHSRYTNLIWMPEFRRVYASTQYLLEFVDTVVTVSSSVGWQCLLWKKRLIVSGSSHLDVIADSHDLADIARPPAAVWPREKDNLLAWLLSHYYIPLDVLRKGAWLVRYLERTLGCDMASAVVDWFEQTENVSKLERIYLDHCAALSVARIPLDDDTAGAETHADAGSGKVSRNDMRMASLAAQAPTPVLWPPLTESQAEALYHEAGRMLAMDDRAGAIDALTGLWARQCTRWEVYCDLGVLLLQAGQADRAVAALNVAARLEKDTDQSLRILAEAYRRTGDIAGILAVCRDLLLRKPKDPEIVEFLSETLQSRELPWDDFVDAAALPSHAGTDASDKSQGCVSVPAATPRSGGYASGVDTVKPGYGSTTNAPFLEALGYLQAAGLSGMTWFSDRIGYRAWDRQIEKVQETIERHIDAYAEFPGYCGICAQPTRFIVSSGLELLGHTHLREGMICPTCRIHNRGRLLGLSIKNAAQAFPTGAGILLMEATTPLYLRLSRMLPGLIGSEYAGATHAPGALVESQGQLIRHESILDLSFADRQLSMIAHADVLEHVPDPARALSECHRALRPGGRLVFTAPFGAESDSTQRRARVTQNGEIEHLLPAEYHGPFLCYHNFGWDLLDLCKDAGFKEVRLGVHFDPLQGLLSTGRFGGFFMQPLIVSCVR